MTFLDHALALAKQGFFVFPIRPGVKAPPIKNWQLLATRDEKTIREWWKQSPQANIGIFTGKFGDEGVQALLAVDVDNKDGKKGDEALKKLEIVEGLTFPETFTQVTPTGGRHLIYVCPVPVKQGTNVLGSGLDIRSHGGYLVAEGSRTEHGAYTADRRVGVAPAPEWLIHKCGQAREKEKGEPERIAGVDPGLAEARAVHYLTKEAPLAHQGEGGDQLTFKVAAYVKDLGVFEDECFALMNEHWNPRCEPPWGAAELRAKVQNAYRYGTNPQGVKAPEAIFASVPVDETEKLHPFEKLNREYAFVLAGGGHHILWETKDANGHPMLEHLNEASFHKKFAAQVMDCGEELKPVTTLWMRSEKRRSYDGICFRPGLETPKGWYNLWRGFTVEPADVGSRAAKDSLKIFLEHANQNVCGGDEALTQWLLGYFAHLIQRPWEKPLVAIVFRGKKGVGKNALLDRVGHLLGNHYLLTSNRRYLVGNFNGHLENCLLFALDEAFWSGDKQAEGMLKDLITGSHHVIEHKGKESYKVENCTRLCIIGNEDWLVPSSHDERRFAVFDVGEGRKQDRRYFQAMREGMEQGGYSLLLRYLLDFDLAGIDINDAPNTQALFDQKMESLGAIGRWWSACLAEGKIVGGDFEDVWPEAPTKDRIRNAFNRYCRDHNIKGSWLPDQRQIGKKLKEFSSAIDGRHKCREDGHLVNSYHFPKLDVARKDWEKYMRHRIEWT